MKTGRYIALLLLLLAGLWYYASLPSPLFRVSYSTVLEDREGMLLGAHIASDGQWRFPRPDSIPEKFKACILLFEDTWFFQHPGFNPFSLVRAALQNMEASRIVSGGSTLSMQTIRLSRRSPPRTFWEKCMEIVLATRLECSFSKEEILSLYAAHAPFGGNVVGLEAAAWRYFGRTPDQLSWGETATLAVLPNSPSLIFPGKNGAALSRKRNRLLDKLYRYRVIDSLSCVLAKAEPLPGKPRPLPALSPHLLTRVQQEGQTGQRVRSTLSASLQQQVASVVQRHHEVLKGNGIFNAAALLLDVHTGEAMAYVGNTRGDDADRHGKAVDIITAPRSTGSVLKPLLYAAMLTEGSLLPHALVADVPTYIRGFVPKNFDEGYDGAVHADEVLSRSLNVPAVLMLQDYGVEKFHYLLRQAGMTTLQSAPGHYGLSLILGGAEASLWDLAGMYAGMARSMRHYFEFAEPRRYALNAYVSPSYTARPLPVWQKSSHGLFSAASLWYTFEAMAKVKRPSRESGWEYYDSSRKIAWKTGTSFGFRDAWAIGLTPEYVVAVWVGNADGEGRPGLTGLTAAAPLLFDIVHLMPETGWFAYPGSDMVAVDISRSSGWRASALCDDVVKTDIPRTGLVSPVCAYHHRVHLDAQAKYRVHSHCEAVGSMQHKSWFVLPAVQEWYYRQKNPSYRPLPPFRADCGPADEGLKPLQMVYPEKNARLYLPRKLYGDRSSVVFEAVHRHASTQVFWHLDGQYLGTTKHVHQMGLQPSAGSHRLVLIDEHGIILEHPFEVR